MNIIIDNSIIEKEPGFIVGYAIINRTTVEKARKPLKKEVMQIISNVRQKYKSRSEMYQSLPIKSMRDLFKRNGIDPTKYTPSAEALLKRIIDGKDLYRINNIVECNNIGSLKYELPMGVYNIDNLVGDVRFTFGLEKDVMETMAKGKMSMKGHLLTKDDERIFGSPISDSIHTKIDNGVEDVLLLVYGTKEIGQAYVREATKYSAEKIANFSGGEVRTLDVISA